MLPGKWENAPNEIDKKIFYSLQKKNPNVFLLVNKIDNEKEQEKAWEFAEFGTQNLFCISVSHNRGIGRLEDSIVKLLKKDSLTLLFEGAESEESLEDFLEAAGIDSQSEIINIGIIGRVNVGKSSLLNALLKQERSVVSEVAGTTIDPVDEMGQIVG